MYMPNSIFLVTEWEINSPKKIRDPARLRTQDLLNTSQTVLPLSQLDPWQRGGLTHYVALNCGQRKLK